MKIDTFPLPVRWFKTFYRLDASLGQLYSMLNIWTQAYVCVLVLFLLAERAHANFDAVGIVRFIYSVALVSCAFISAEFGEQKYECRRSI